MRRKRHAIEDLRRAIDCLPVDTRGAMLQGVRANDIIVGAYTDRSGGVCPMLAAHRCGGRTDFLSFAKSWDRFARARRTPREATEREVAILIRQLEDSLQDAGGLELDVAIAEHHALVGRSRRRARRLADPADPVGEIRARRLGPALRRLLTPGVAR